MGWIDAEDLLVVQHVDQGHQEAEDFLFALEWTSELTPGKPLIGCGNGCHLDVLDPLPNVDELDPRWMAPVSNLSGGSTVNFGLAPSKVICEQVTDILSDQASLEDHFYRDARLLWAVASRQNRPNWWRKPTTVA